MNDCILIFDSYISRFYSTIKTMDVSIQIKRLKFAQNTIIIDCKTERDKLFPFHTKEIHLRVKSRRHINLKFSKDFADIRINNKTFA